MITSHESSVIRYLRSIAMLSIVICHFQQAYDNKWAWVFNVGVQMFLTLSGWLYGNKNITNWKKWCKDKIYKLYIPYIIYVLSVFVVYRLFSIDTFTVKNLVIYIFDAQWILGNVKGMSHLWFMTAIALCYMLTPFLQYIRNKGYVFICLLLHSCVGILNTFVFHLYLDVFVCLFIYVFSYLFASLSSLSRRVYMVCIFGLFGYILYTINWQILLDYSNGLNKMFHMLLAFLCIMLPIIISNRFKTIKVPSLVSRFDRDSYYIYITHHIFMLGPLSLAFYTQYKVVNVGMIIVLTLLSSFLLKLLTEIILNKFKNIRL
jgi:peptidoglycan/LPS O-acetylase OafA/YrhL